MQRESFFLFLLFFVDNLSFLWLIYFSRLDNEIGDAGVSDIAEALKVNNTLNEIICWSELMVFLFSVRITTFT